MLDLYPIQPRTRQAGMTIVVMRLEQRAAVAFTLVSVAIVVILLITLWAYLF
jgi:hypothetical protein